MKENLIRKVPLFTDLPPAEITTLSQGLREVSFPANTVLFEEREQGDRFFIVVSGEIAIIKAMGTGAERLVSVRGPGEFVGEMSLLNRDGLRTASARTQCDVLLLELSRADFDSLLKREPGLAYEMLKVLSQRLREAHDVTIRDLQEKNRELAEAYQNLKAAQDQIIESETLERELAQARDIQENMLPRVLPGMQGFDLSARIAPARMVGGDLYDVFPLDEDSLGLVVGDVSGKGVPAALFMALTRSLVRSVATQGARPAAVLGRVNQLLLEMNASHMFVTLFYGVLRRATQELEYVRAGHEVPILRRPDGSVTRPEMGRGQILGLFAAPTLETRRLSLPPGSTLLLFTDGVVEARNSEGDFFGLARLENAIKETPLESGQALCDHLVDLLADFRGPAPQYDDLTLLAVRALPTNPGQPRAR